MSRGSFVVIIFLALLCNISCKVFYSGGCDFESRLVFKLIPRIRNIQEKKDFDICLDPVFDMKGKGFIALQEKYGLSILKDSNEKVIEFSPELAHFSCTETKKNNIVSGYYKFSPVMVNGKKFFIAMYYYNADEEIVELYSFRMNHRCDILELMPIDGYFIYHN